MKRAQLQTVDFVRAAINNANNKAEELGRDAVVPADDEAQFKKFIAATAAEFGKFYLSGFSGVRRGYRIPPYLIEHAKLICGPGSSTSRSRHNPILRTKRRVSDRRKIRPSCAQL